jgi:hypothetical protein
MRLLLLAPFLSGSSWAETAFVHASGRALVVSTGDKVLPRGINLGNWLEPEGCMFLFEKGPASPCEIEKFFIELVGLNARRISGANIGSAILPSVIFS